MTILSCIVNRCCVFTIASCIVTPQYCFVTIVFCIDTTVVCIKLLCVCVGYVLSCHCCVLISSLLHLGEGAGERFNFQGLVCFKNKQTKNVENGESAATLNKYETSCTRRASVTEVYITTGDNLSFFLF